ncbi:hypothetical protein AB0F18_05355 [Streptomyces sp. NPDC029216]|uniref:hypothetical protein n=1 Tax=Streptomyces sp. NPDC029216 TaxID=3154701 RepID=UPI0033E2F7EF
MRIFEDRTPNKRTHEVFGISNKVLLDSYVDRGELDEEIQRLLMRHTHIALRGASKCGKSWLRQKVLPNAIVVQCRLGETVDDIYREALGELGIRLEVNSTSHTNFVGKAEASGEVGIKLLAKVTGKAGIERGRGKQSTTKPVSADVESLRFVAEILRESGRRLVIEDFHYLPIKEKARFSGDIKALWDLGVFLIVVGVWNQQNMLIYLNPDLSGRVHETSIVWGEEDLDKIFQFGGRALNVEFTHALRDHAIEICHGNAGILQALILGTLDRVGVDRAQEHHRVISDIGDLEQAAQSYADQLHPLYQEFARRVANGIRARKNSTSIYAHAMAVILSASDQELIQGLNLNHIYLDAHARESRITKQNLQRALERIESLQVDASDGTRLVLAYNVATKDVTVVDRQLLLYRQYSTIGWPWEDLISEAKETGEQFDEGGEQS